MVAKGTDNGGSPGSDIGVVNGGKADKSGKPGILGKPPGGAPRNINLLLHLVSKNKTLKTDCYSTG